MATWNILWLYKILKLVDTFSENSNLLFRCHKLKYRSRIRHRSFFFDHRYWVDPRPMDIDPSPRLLPDRWNPVILVERNKNCWRSNVEQRVQCPQWPYMVQFSPSDNYSSQSSTLDDDWKGTIETPKDLEHFYGLIGISEEICGNFNVWLTLFGESEAFNNS